MNFAVIPGLGTVGPTELIIVLTIILLLFGAKRIPELARGLGSGIREFKKGTRGEVDEEKKGEELTSGANAADEDTPDARQRKEAARAEHTTERDAERDAQRAEQKR
jgi:sec-independent protein translocase protein TatA